MHKVHAHTDITRSQQGFMYQYIRLTPLVIRSTNARMKWSQPLIYDKDTCREENVDQC